MAVVQFMCAKIGLASGRGLAGVLRHYYPRTILYPAVLCLVVANTINAGTDIGAIAAAINLIIPIPITALIVPIALIIVALQIWGSYRLIANVFRWLILSLFAYIAAALLAKPNWDEVIRATFIPTLRFDREYLLTLVAILGTTISPYLFFWQASEEVEEEINEGRKSVRQRKGVTDAELKKAKWDTIVGMFFCNIVFYFVILAAGATLHAPGKTDIQSASDAAQALQANCWKRRDLSVCRRNHWGRLLGSTGLDRLERLCRRRDIWVEIWTQYQAPASQAILRRHRHFNAHWNAHKLRGDQSH
jgi:NRAMP (natural resistance-associated macrophage protein)-like metal ion transporter